MKNIKSYFLCLLALLLTGACSDELMNPIPTIEINPGFAKPGLSALSVVSQNETDVHKITYSRNYGISRDLTMKLIADEASLKAYNEENNTDYKLLPAEFYSMPGETKFDVKSKSADFEVTFHSKKLFEAAGSVEAASKYVLPVKAITDQKSGVDADETKNTSLMRISMVPATVTTVVPATPYELFFAMNSGSEEEIFIEGALNFKGIDAGKISVVIDKSADLLAGDDYKLLPEANYSFETATVNAAGNVSVKGTVNADGLDEDSKYLLPCRLQSSNPNYVISQSEPVYYVLTITAVEVSIADANDKRAKTAYTSIATLTGSVNVSLNSIIPDDLTINFDYNPSLIATFNAANGENYQTLPENAVKIQSGKITGGQKTAAIPYEIDLTSLKLSDGIHYLVPLTLQEDDLEVGTISGSHTLYLDITKTLVGEYNLEVITNERTRNVMNTIWNASQCQRGADANWASVMDKAQYGFGGDGDWYAVLFSVTDEDMPDKPNCKKITIYTFLELIEETGGTNKVSNNKSYFNTVTGEVYIDCSVYESWFQQNYKEVYSFKRK